MFQLRCILAERGYNVHVVEANRVGWGASGRNGGELIDGVSGGKHLERLGGEKLAWEMHWAGHEIIRSRVSEYDIQCDLKFGYLDLAIKERHLRDLREELEYFERFDFPHEVRILNAQETREAIGTDVYVGSMLNMANGHLHPLNLCIGEARAAVSKGATFYEQSPVERIEYGSKPDGRHC